MDYPKHLSEKIREEVAVCYLGHELRKLFLNIVDSDISGLMTNKSLAIPRDFWNGVHGIGMGFKLHVGFIYLITAENIIWTREKININQLFFGVDRKITKKYATKSVQSIIEKIYDSSSQEIYAWDRDPIFVIEKSMGLAVYTPLTQV